MLKAGVPRRGVRETMSNEGFDTQTIEEMLKAYRLSASKAAAEGGARRYSKEGSSVEEGAGAGSVSLDAQLSGRTHGGGGEDEWDD